MRSFYPALFFCFLLISCSETEEKSIQDVRSVVTSIIDADNHADLERVLSFYHSDAILMPPGKPEIKGAVNIRKNYENIFTASNLNLTIEEDEIVFSKNYAICKGRTKGKVASKSDSTEKEVNDKFIMVLQRQGDQWKIKTLIWN